MYINSVQPVQNLVLEPMVEIMDSNKNEALMLTMLTRLTMSERQIYYFRGSVVLHTLERSITDQINCILSQLQRRSQTLLDT